MIAMIYNELLNRDHLFDIDESYLKSIGTDNLTFNCVRKSFYTNQDQLTESLRIYYDYITTRGAKKDVALVFRKSENNTKVEVSGWISPKKTIETMNELGSLILKIANHVSYDGEKDIYWYLSKEIEYDIIGD